MSVTAALPPSALFKARRRTPVARLAVAIVATVAVVAAGATWVPEPAAGAAATPAKPACPDSREDFASAAAAARLCGGRVEVTGAMTDDSRSWANANGSVSVEQTLGPVRVHRPDGTWAPVDLNLAARADGSISPRAHSGDLWLSGAQAGGGEHVIAATGAGDERVALTLTGAVPVPRIAGNKAVYSDLRPGVDLVLEATATGFEQSWVVKDRSGLAQVKNLALAVAGPAVARHATDAGGETTLKDAQGHPIAVVHAPLMWDAATDERGGHAHEKGVPVRAARRASTSGKGLTGEQKLLAKAGVTVTLTPDAAWLADPSRQFPITIDPSVSTYRPSSDLYWIENSTAVHTGDNNLQIGLFSPDGLRRRAGLSWNTSSWSHAFILSASLNLFNYWSGACARAQWELWRLTGSFGSTWDTMGTWQSLEATSSQTKGYYQTTPCGDGDDGYVSIDATSFFQKASSAGESMAYMGLKATDEATPDATWKQFRTMEWTYSSAWPYIDLTYWPLSTVTSRSMAPSAPAASCATGASRPLVNSLTPTLQAAISNPLGGQMYGRFELQILDGATTVVPVTSTGQMASGSTATYAVPAGKLVNGQSYRWHVAADDNHMWSGDGLAPYTWSPWCEFTVDTTAPGAPYVSSPQFPENSATPANVSSGTFSFTHAAADADVAAYTYQLDTDTAASEVAADAAGAASVTITPALHGHRVLTVRAKDKAGNLGTPKLYAFTIGRAAIATPREGAQIPAQTSLSLDIPDTSLTRVRFLYRRGPGSTELPVPWANLSTAPGSAITDPAVGQNTTWSGYRDIKAGDFTGDGKPDLVAVRTSDNTLVRWTGNGDGTFAFDGGMLTGWSGYAKLAGGDYNGDGKADLLAVRTSDGALMFAASSGASGFAAPTVVGSGWNQFTNLVGADVGADGKTDILAVRISDGLLFVWAGLGNVTFGSPTQVGSGWSAFSNLMAVDYNGDAKMDLLAVRTADGYLCRWPGTGPSTWGSAYAIGSGWNTYDKLTAADFSGDGKADIHAVRTSDGFMGRYIGDGGGGFAIGTDLPQAVSGLAVPVSSLNGSALWRAADTLGRDGGVVQVRAALQPASDTDPVYYTGYVTFTLDPDADGAASTAVGPGSVNLVTGDYTLSSTDVDEFGLTVNRTASSRRPDDGWLPQGERLTVNQQQVSTDASGFTTGWATATQDVSRGQGGSRESLKVTPAASGSTVGDTFAAAGGDTGGMRLGVLAGHRYRFTGWIYVPAATGLSPVYTTRGERIVVFYKTAAGYSEVPSSQATFVDGWQRLSVDALIPADATEAFVRLYDGFATGTDKPVYWDNLSVKELVAPFGPQWHGGVTDAQVDSDYTDLTFPSPELAKVTTAEGAWVTFAKNATTGAFTAEPGSEDLTLTKVDATHYRVSEVDGTVTEFTQQSGSAAFLVTSSWDASNAATTKTNYIYDLTDNRALVTRVINPVEPGVGDCTTATPAKGCQVLEYQYATATTATGTTSGTFGNYKDQVYAVRLWASDPQAGMTAVEVAHYAYDNQGRLREVWDPRVANPIKNVYTYDSAGRVINAQAGTDLPWKFEYGTIGSDPNAGRLHRVRRASIVQGTAATVGPDNITRVVYDVPLTAAAGGPQNLDAATIASWAQTDRPTSATAIFGPQDDPLVQRATSTTPGSGGYAYATVHYLNASGLEVNTLNPGGHLDTSEYDRFGHVVRTLEATNWEMALGTLPGGDAYLNDLGLTSADSATRAQALSSYSTYSLDGIDLVDELGPVERTVLEQQLVDPNGVKPTLPAKTIVVARDHTVNRYDEGKPDGQNYHLVTTILAGGSVAGYGADADTRTVRTGYDAINGSASGWVLKAPTSMTNDAGVAYTVYDASGRPLSSWRVGTDGQQTLKKVTVYYTAGANPDPADGSRCSNRAEWSGQPCVTRQEGTITGADTSRMSATLPVRFVASYSRTGEPQFVSETVGGNTTAVTTDTFTATARYLRLNVTAPTQTTDNAARIYEFEAYAPGGSTNLALNKTATASSSCNANEGPEKAVNGSVTGGTSDKWCAGPSDPAKWWQVDLASAQPVGKVVIKHAATGNEAAAWNTREYTIQASTDGSNWTTVVTVDGSWRAAITGYDAADRITSSQALDDTGSFTLPANTTVYDPNTGRTAETTWTAGGTTWKIQRAYDIAGRIISYTDADGAATTSEYDQYGRPAKTTDPHGNRTYTYDRSLEPRGMLTSITDSVAGTFGAGYSPDGQLVRATYPGGMTRTDTLDSGLKPVQRVYTRDSDHQPIYSDSVITNTADQVVDQTTSNGHRIYNYDSLGRLTSVADTPANVACTTRTYEYDTRANRTAKRTYAPNGDGTCQTGTQTAADTHTYDTADRLTDASYTYDAFGRTRATPGGNTFTYYVNDLVNTQQLGSQRRTWSLDPTMRVRGVTTESEVNGQWTNATAKIQHYGDDSDEPTWIVEDPTQGTYSRNVAGPNGDLAAVTNEQGLLTLQLTNLHGDVAATIDTTVANLAGVTMSSYDEFGIPAAGQAAQRYGWLGGKQRSAETLDGTILMGVRLYSPVLGRFLQVDPEDGGSCSAYDYVCADPVNAFDLEGKGFWSSLKKGLNVVAQVASVASMIPGPIGTICGVVSAAAYVATGNWKEAAWAVGGALAATVGLGAAVKGARLAIGAVKAARAAGKFASFGSKVAKLGAGVSRVASKVRSGVSGAGRRIADAVRGCGNSFDGSTPVLMADGTYLPIQDIQPGDYVEAVDPQTGLRRPEPVLTLIAGNGTRHLIDLDLDGDAEPDLTTTAEHPIWVLDRGWTHAVDLVPGDVLVLEGGRPAGVQRVTDRGWLADQYVYNLTVGDLHTFIVLAAGHEVLVHNAYCKVSKTMKTWRAAKAAAQQMAKRVSRKPGQRGEYRGPCSSGDHYHCDIFDRAGNKLATVHFRWRIKTSRRVS